MRAARRGDRPALHDAIVAREKAGDLSDSDAAKLAKVVAESELRAASGADAAARVRGLRPCAHELDDALSVRMLTHDAAGAQAALARIDGGAMRLDEARKFATDADADWRAVTARSLVRPDDRGARLRALVDPDPGVRRQAARAARDARDATDLGALVEAARVDPVPLVRTEALRAIAALPAEASRHVVDVLRDLWRSGDDGLREDIASAWSSAALWGAGGRDELYIVLATEHGPAVVEAAAAVLRRPDADAEVTQVAAAQLERAIESGSLGTRLQALAQAPLDRAEVLAAVRNALDSDDLGVRVAALGRLTEAKDLRVASLVAELESLARPGSPMADRARFALALSGDLRVQAWIEEDLAAARPERRLVAATALAALGRAARAATLLADENAAVRLGAACTMILSVRR